MHRKILGVFALMLGLLVVLACAFGLRRTAVALDETVIVGADPDVWAAHWRTSLVTYLLLGLLAAIGGALVLYKNAIGTLLVSAAAVIAASFPWILSASGYAIFGFEQPNVFESCLEISLGAFMFLMYRQRALWMSQ